MELVKEYLGKVSLTTDGKHDINKAYARLCCVYIETTFKQDGVEYPIVASYISRKSVPKGVSISDNNYWMPIAVNFAGALTKDMLGKPNGVATLNESGLVPSSQLPSYVDDVIEYDTYDDFPEVGEKGKIYLALDILTQYRWSGSTYVKLDGISLHGTSGGKFFTLSNIQDIDFNEPLRIIDIDEVDSGTNTCGIEIDYAAMFNSHTQKSDPAALVQYNKAIGIYLPQATDERDGAMSYKDKLALDAIADNCYAGFKIKTVTNTDADFPNVGVYLLGVNKDGEEDISNKINLFDLTIDSFELYGPGQSDYVNGDGVVIYWHGICNGSYDLERDYTKVFDIPIVTKEVDGLMLCDDYKTLKTLERTAATHDELSSAIQAAFEDYTLPVATDKVLGGIKVNGTASLTANSSAYLKRHATTNMALIEPATYNTYGVVKLFNNTKVTRTINTVSTIPGRDYGVQVNNSGQLVVNVPWITPAGTDGITVDEYGIATLNLETDEGRTSETYTVKLQDKDSTKNLLDLTIPAADTSNAGLMSADDKTKLDSLSTEAVQDVIIMTQEEKLCYVNISNLSIGSGGALSGTVSSFKLPDDMTVSEFNDLLRCGQLKTKVSFDIAWNSPSTTYLKGYPKGCTDYIYDDGDSNKIMELPNMSWKKGSRVYLQFIIDGMNITKCTLFGLYTS